MAKDHGSSVKDDKQYEGLRKKGMSKSRAAKIANTPNASKKGGKSSGGGSGGGRRRRRRLEVAEGLGRPQGRQEVELGSRADPFRA